MVVQQLEEFRDNSEYSLGDCAILYRTNAQSRVFEEILTRNGIPYSLVGGFKFYERKEIKDLLAYLRLLINPDSDLDFTRVVNTPARGIGKVTLQKLQKISLQKGLSLYKTVKFLEQNKDEIKPAPLKKLLAFCQIFDQVREENRLMDPARAVELILLHSGYKEALVNEDSIEAESRIENLDEFFNMAMVFREKEKEELGIFLQELSLLTDLDDFQESDERITLMTVHAAKGLEFPVTFLTGLEDDLFPHIRSKENDQEIQEERRLLYVAITRTRRHLNLSYCRMRRVQGMPLVRRMSPFFNRIPEDLFQCYCMVGGQIFERTRAELLATPIREPGSYNKFSGQRYKGGSNYSSTNYNVSKTSNSSPVSPRRAAGNSASGVEGDQDLTKGGLVTHKKFGRGVVKSTEGRGEECKATVIFESGATKKILARFLSAC